MYACRGVTMAKTGLCESSKQSERVANHRKKMTPKERQLAAIRGELTDRISVDAIYIHNQPEIAKLMGVSSTQVLDEFSRLSSWVFVQAKYAGNLIGK